MKNRTLRLAFLGLFSALLLVMAFTPLGYLRVGPLSITFMTIPVVLAATLLGPGEGMILGLLFGLTSFAQCFGMDAFGTALFSISPVFTAIVCLVPRVLIGTVSGFLYKALHKVNDIVRFGMACFAGALTNTVFFVGFLLLFFGNSDYLHSFGSTIPAILGALVTVNSVVELIVCTILGTAIAKALRLVMKKIPQNS